MQVLIIEDEMLAVERLQTLLKEYDNTIRVAACLESIEETVQYFQTKPHPDLLLVDIHLSDGHCFEIFRRIAYKGPVIFTTAYNQYAIEAFKLFSIDYILKPVTLEALAGAINKYKQIASGFIPVDYSRLVPHITAEDEIYKSRFLAKVGQRLFFVSVEDIAYFQADNKIVYLVDMVGNRFVIDYTLEKLEALLDPKRFFRLNRTYLVHIQAIRQIKPYYNNRLKLQVKGVNACPEEELVISRERVADFRAWAEG